MIKIVKGVIAQEREAFVEAGRIRMKKGVNSVKAPREQDDAMAAVVGVQGEGGAGAAGEYVGEAWHPVNRGKRVAGGDEEIDGYVVQRVRTA